MNTSLSNTEQKNKKVLIEVDQTTYETLVQLKSIDSIAPKVRIQNIIRTIVSEGKLTAHTGM